MASTSNDGNNPSENMVTVYYEDGGRYVGEFKDDKYDGRGTRAYEDGSRYEGTWKAGLRDGKGTFTNPDGERYVGEWKDDLRAGWGTCNYEDGSKYAGEWKGDLRDGRGTLTYANGEQLDGEFKAGEYFGKEIVVPEPPISKSADQPTIRELPKSNHPGGLQEVRIFLSSTFMDLNEERQYLMNKVFPIFAARLRKRAVDFNVIDLRWGIQPEARIGEKGVTEKVGKNTLEVCLKETVRCYPMFIGIVGGRYGWIPAPQDVDRETDFYRKYQDKIDGYLSARKSITEMEILFGVLEREAPAIDSRFYIGEEIRYQDKLENYTGYSKSVQEQKAYFEEAKSKQKALREGLMQSETIDFADAENLGNAVLTDMECLMDRLEQQGQIPAIDLSEEELQKLEITSFEMQKLKGYVKRSAEEVLDSYLEKLLSNGSRDAMQPLFLVGAPGSGKSTMLAGWSSQLASVPNLVTIKVYIGIHSKITTQNDLIREILGILKERFDMDRELPLEEELCNQFEIWLGLVTKPTLILIDGIDQLMDFSTEMSWIPQRLRQTVGLIVTSNLSIRISTRSIFVNEHRLVGFSPREKEGFIYEYLLQASKSISDEGKLALMEETDVLNCNPLALSAMLKELVRSGRRDIYTREELDRREFPWDSVLGIISSLAPSKSMEELFLQLFERYEVDYGKRLVEQLLSLLALSRSGMYYQELVDLVMEEQEDSLSGMEFQAVFSILEESLTSINSKLAFSHAHLKNVAENKYKTTAVRYREQLAAYYLRLLKTPGVEIDLHQAEEMAWQLEKLNRWRELYEAISNSQVLYWLLNHNMNGVAGYFKHFKELGYNYKTFYEKIKPAIQSDEGLVNLVSKLFYLNGEFELSLELMEDQQLELQQKYGEDDPGLWTAWHNLGTTYRAKGEYDKAIELLKKAASKRASRFGEDTPELLMTWTSLATTYYELGDLEAAISLFEKVAEKQEERYGIEYEGLRTTWNNLALCYSQNGEVVKALDLLKKAGAKEETKNGEDDPGVWTIWSNYALACYQRGDYELAIEFLEKVAAKQEERYGEDNTDLWTTWNNLAQNYDDKGEKDKAISLFEKAAVKMERKYGVDYPDLWTIWHNLAGVYMETGAPQKAIPLLEKAAAGREAKFGTSHSGLWDIWASLANAYKKNGDRSKAKELQKKLSKYRLLTKGFLVGGTSEDLGGNQEDMYTNQQNHTFQDGSTYVGEFKYGMPHGQGTLRFTNGDRYVGEVRAGAMHGRGTYYFANGNIYVGEVEAGEITGKGELKLAESRVVCVGLFKKGELVRWDDED